MLLLKEYLCSSDDQEAPRCLKDDPYFHNEHSECDREYAREVRRSNMQGVSGTFHKLCAHHHTVFTIEKAFMTGECGYKMLDILAVESLESFQLQLLQVTSDELTILLLFDNMLKVQQSGSD